MFYNRLQQRCSELQTTPTALAKELCISTSNVTNWKKGTMPNGDVLIRLSEFLNISIDYLLTGKEPNAAQTDTPASALPTILSDDETNLIELYRKLPERKQTEFIGELKGYIKCLSDISQADPIKKIAE